MALSRLLDPYLFKVLKNSLCKGSYKGELVYFDESLLSFLNCAMNVEFVYLILLGIKKFLNHEKDLAISSKE